MQSVEYLKLAHFVSADQRGDLPPVNSAFMMQEGRGRERGRDQV